MDLMKVPCALENNAYCAIVGYCDLVIIIVPQIFQVLTDISPNFYIKY